MTQLENNKILGDFGRIITISNDYCEISMGGIANILDLNRNTSIFLGALFKQEIRKFDQDSITWFMTKYGLYLKDNSTYVSINLVLGITRVIKDGKLIAVYGKTSLVKHSK